MAPKSSPATAPPASSSGGCPAKPAVSKPRSPLWTLAHLVPVFFAITGVCIWLHYRLPAPVISGYNYELSTPQFSEHKALEHIQALEDVGYRIVGTKEHAAGLEYVLRVADELIEKCLAFPELECEVWHQQGSGSHRFNIMDHDVLKTYASLSNVILRISNGSDEAKANALLLNAHVDSQITGPGAADDAIGVGIMMELARVLIERGKPFENALVFLFNNAEESLQGASHLYSTQHETASTIRAVVNLEAAGSTGSEMLFQATSKEMVEAYSKVPYPHGTVLAADVFSSGIIGSDTDFGQFENYLDIGGLDMAVVGHSWYYHTTKDILANIQAGTTQHFGENVLAIIDHVTGPDSKLAEIKKGRETQTMVYTSFFDLFFIKYDLEQAGKIARAIAAVFGIWSINSIHFSAWRAYVLALFGTVGSLFGSILGANMVAGIMVGSNHAMSWFSSEFYAPILYVPPAFAGAWTVQYFILRLVRPADLPFLEHAAQFAQLALYVSLMGLAQLFNVRSGSLFAFLSGSGVLSLGLNELMSWVKGSRADRGTVHLTTYLIAMVVPTILGVEATTGVLMIFVPLTGRMGEQAPAEFIIANIMAITTFFFIPTSISFFHRFPMHANFKRYSLGLLYAISGLAILGFVFKSPYDAEHPRRLFFAQEFNSTSETWTFHAAAMDSAPGVPEVMKEIHTVLKADPATPARYQPIEEFNPSWDSLYPIGNFFSTWQFPLPQAIETTPLPKVTIKALSDTYDDSTDLRSIRLGVSHRGLIWPTLAFSANITSWPFNSPPPVNHVRHHLKGASDHGFEEYEVAFTVVGRETFWVDWTAVVENGIWKSTGKTRGKDTAGSARWGELDAYLEETRKGAVDSLMLTTVVGVVEI